MPRRGDLLLRAFKPQVVNAAARQGGKNSRRKLCEVGLEILDLAAGFDAGPELAVHQRGGIAEQPVLVVLADITGAARSAKKKAPRGEGVEVFSGYWRPLLSCATREPTR